MSVIVIPNMHLFISETLRLYPSLPILTRKCTKTYRLPDTDLTIEKGVRVIIPNFAINQDPDIYPDPQRFDPGRFEPTKVKEHQTVNLHFGDGPMACVGKACLSFWENTKTIIISTKKYYLFFLSFGNVMLVQSMLWWGVDFYWKTKYQCSILFPCLIGKSICFFA